MDALIVKVVPRHEVARQVFDGVVCDLLSSYQEQRLMSFRICRREAIQCPSESSGPSGVGAKALMRVCEKPLSRRGIAPKGEYDVLRSAVQSKALPAIAWVVMYRLKDGSIRAHEPFRSSEGVLLADFPPPFVARFFACPPEQLQIHHRVNDRVVAVHAPRRDQLRFRIEELFQPLDGAQSAGAKCLITSRIKSHSRRGVIQKSCIMILLRLLTAQLRTQ